MQAVHFAKASDLNKPAPTSKSAVTARRQEAAKKKAALETRKHNLLEEIPTLVKGHIKLRADRVLLQSSEMAPYVAALKHAEAEVEALLEIVQLLQ